MEPKNRFLVFSIIAACTVLIFANSLSAQTGGDTGSSSRELKQVEQKDSVQGARFGHLQYRDRIVVISKGSKGYLYTVKDKGGKTLHMDLMEKDFQAKYPALYDRVKNGYAGNDAALRKSTQAPAAPAAVRDVPLEAKPAK